MGNYNDIVIENADFINHMKTEDTKAEILDYFTVKILKETGEPNLSKAWDKWREMNGISIDEI